MATGILHLADMHFGAAPASLPPAVAATLHRERLAALTAALATAVERHAAAVLVAGDLLEARLAVREHAASLAAAFARCGLPVVIVPGNHDPAGPGSYYRTYPWPDNVTVVAEERWTAVELPDLTVHALGWTGGAVTQPPLPGPRLPAVATRPQVLLLHADLDPPGGRSPYRPVSGASIAATGADYAALGHIHARLLAGTAAYPGSLTPLGFGEEGRHGALWVRLGAGAPVVEPLPVARRRFRTVEVTCGEQADAADAARAALPPGSEDDLIRLRLLGQSPAAGIDEAALRELAWHVEVLDETEPALDLDALIADHPSGLLARFVAAMHARIAAEAQAAQAARAEVAAAAPVVQDLDGEPAPPAPSVSELALRYGVQALTGRRLQPW